MDKHYRKQLEQQLALAIDYFLRKTDEQSADKIAKLIKSSSKDLAKKFVKAKEAINEKKTIATEANKIVTKSTVKSATKKSVAPKTKKTATRKTKKVSVKAEKASVAKKTLAKKFSRK